MQLTTVQSEDGFTLVELLVVVVILGLVGAVTLTGLVQGMNTARQADQRVEALTDLQRASERVSRDLRRGVWTDISVTPVPTPAAGCTYISMNPDELTLIVFDGSARTRHRYFHAANTLSLDLDRWTGTAWADVSQNAVIDGLANTAQGIPVFSFLDAQGTDLLADGLQGSDRAKVRKFRFALAASLPDAPPVDVSTVVTARNGGMPCPVA